MNSTKNGKKFRKGSTVVVAMMASVIVGLVALMVPALIKSASEKSYMSYLKNESNKLETRMRIFLSSRTKWQLDPSGMRLTDAAKADFHNMPENFGVFCRDPNEDCGFYYKDEDGDGVQDSEDPDITYQLYSDGAASVMKFTIGFKGKGFYAFERVVQIQAPKAQDLADPNRDRCPASQPILVGLDNNSSVICKELGSVFLNGVPTTMKCDPANPQAGCYMDSGQCPPGFLAKVENFKVQCYEMPKIACPLGQVLKSLRIDTQGNPVWDCMERPELADLLLPPPGGVPVPLEVETLSQ